jgi:hypothetical protein
MIKRQASLMREGWKMKGGITIQKLVLVVIGVSVTAIVMLTIKNAIDSAYAQGLENALE